MSAEPGGPQGTGRNPQPAAGEETPATAKKPGRHGTPLRNIPSASVHTGVFGIVGEGNSFVYVFDNSASMGSPNGRPLAAAKRELLSSLDTLGRLQQFQIIFYNSAPHIFSPPGMAGRPIFANDDNKELGRNFVASIKAELATDHEPALALALRLQPDVIFFLTDGEQPPLSREQLNRIDRINGGLSVIHVIQFGRGERRGGANWLTRLAEENRGQYRFVDASELGQRP